MPGFTLIGVPSSAGTHGVGQEKAPMQLRRAGLVDRLLDSGVDVDDGGDLPLVLYRPGSKDPRAQNLDQVIMVAQRVADRVEHVAADGRLPLVVGGDCTITLGVVAGLLRGHPDLGLLYFDGDIDLGTPATSRSGILDSMGVAHLLGDGAPTLAQMGPRHPMLSAERLVLFGYDESDLDSDDAEEWSPGMEGQPPPALLLDFSPENKKWIVRSFAASGGEKYSRPFSQGRMAGVSIFGTESWTDYGQMCCPSHRALGAQLLIEIEDPIDGGHLVTPN